jgi:hypothetical protein
MGPSNATRLRVQIDSISAPLSLYLFHVVRIMLIPHLFASLVTHYFFVGVSIVNHTLQSSRVDILHIYSSTLYDSRRLA